MFINIFNNFTGLSIFMLVMFFYIRDNEEYKDKLMRYLNKFQEILNNVHLYNSTIIHFYESDDNNDNTDDKIENNIEENKKEESETVQIVEEKYEDKYLKKFKEFPNDFFLTDEEKISIEKEFERIKHDDEKSYDDKYEEIRQQLDKIQSICDKECDKNKYDIDKLLEYFGLLDEYIEDPESVDINECIETLRSDKSKVEEDFKLLLENALTDDEIYMKAQDIVINKKLDNNINNYIMEYTPLGNVFMRYNNDKKSFEYFSNNSIPYRYLEPVGRKYVMTFHCKPIFVDLEEELKKAEEVWNKQSENKQSENKQKQDHLSKFKKYNTQDILKQSSIKRKQSNFVLPPQIKANLPNIHQKSEKQLLKENANRYTWEGRLTTFNPLKKIDKKLVDKNLSLSFADFKRLQQNKK